METQNYTVQLTETRRYEVEIYAESEEKAIAICKKLNEECFLEFDSEDVISVDYKIKGRVNNMEIQKISIPATEYESLVRKSEKLDILKRFIKKGKYTTMDDIQAILGDEEKEGDQNEPV